MPPNLRNADACHALSSRKHTPSTAASIAGNGDGRRGHPLTVGTNQSKQAKLQRSASAALVRVPTRGKQESSERMRGARARPSDKLGARLKTKQRSSTSKKSGRVGCTHAPEPVSEVRHQANHACGLRRTPPAHRCVLSVIKSDATTTTSAHFQSSSIDVHAPAWFTPTLSGNSHLESGLICVCVAAHVALAWRSITLNPFFDWVLCQALDSEVFLC